MRYDRTLAIINVIYCIPLYGGGVAGIVTTMCVCIYIYIYWLAVWLSGNAFASINVVALRQTQLVPGWVTVYGRVTVGR